jgi:hypothetical protein
LPQQVRARPPASQVQATQVQGPALLTTQAMGPPLAQGLANRLRE